MSRPTSRNNPGPGACVPRSGAGRREAGFTLVEVMVALALATVLAGVTFTIVASASRRSRDLAEGARLRERAAAVLSLVTGDLAGAFVPPDLGAFPYFIGEEGFSGDRPACSVELVTTSAMPFDPEAPVGDLAEVGYRLTFPATGPGTLTRREEAPPRDPEGEGGETVEVCGGVTGFSLSYSDGKEWYPRWDSVDSGAGWSRAKVPREVEVAITIEGRNGDAVSLSTRVALPMAQARP